MNADADLLVRRYGAGTGGAVLLDIEGRQDRLDPLRGACIAPDAWHAQRGVGANESLILDIDPATLAHPAWGRLLERPFMSLGPGARKLVEFMGVTRAQAPALPTLLHAWVPLLPDTLALDAPRPASRLAALLARVEAEPGLAWTTDTMARCAGVSVPLRRSRWRPVFRTRAR